MQTNNNINDWLEISAYRRLIQTNFLDHSLMYAAVKVVSRFVNEGRRRRRKEEQADDQFVRQEEELQSH